MDTAVLIKQALNGSMLGEIGHEFFADKSRTAEETKQFITALLEREAYENLAAVMSCGHISESGAEVDYLPNKNRKAQIADRYFKGFIGLCEQSGVDNELLNPMLFSAFTAPKGSYLRSFVGGVDAYLTKLAYKDYDGAAEIMRRYDKSYRCLSILMEVDEARTLDGVLNDLIYGKNVNKTALRKYLMEKKVDIVPALCAQYVKSNVKAKEGIVRLLLLYKNESRAALFLSEIEQNETSSVIKKLLERDKTVQSHAAEIKGSGGQAYVTVEDGGKKYTVSLEEDLSLKISPRPFPKSAEKAAAEFEKQLRLACADFETAMADNVRYSCDFFENYIVKDSLLSAIASTLLFSVYKRGALSDIIVVDKGEIHDLDNQVKVLSDVEISVSHPVEWGTKFSFLRQLDIKQPFAQIRRDFYTATDAEKNYNFCSRVHGTVMQAGEFKAALKKAGFKILNKNKYGESSCAGLLKGGIMCVLEFAATDFSAAERLISMGDIRFYQYADLIKLSGQTYTDGVMPYSVQSLPSIMFSEFLHDVFKMLNCR